ncbi:orotate phosphoribosyltransferase [Bacterioplanes sanyensis]|uniref:Orotate phosphoribosyltransferase n=2 Tax=Bacterioplanes sanyensis TaxID=1249553 RepID=A0A222FEC2_9GAMM|nr:orotate phosphoribosyltransferase [Bacterioplanes sanyensis]
MTLAQRIKDIAELQGQFTLRSGKTSDRYFDKYRIESDPSILADLAQHMVTLIPAETEVLCGLEMGGIPIVTMMSHYSGLPAAFIRKQAKEHGTCRYAEGADLHNKKIVLVEDVVSSGGAIIDATNMLRADGIEVTLALCAIDRQTGGKEKLADHGVDLKSALTAADLDNAGQS